MPPLGTFIRGTLRLLFLYGLFPISQSGPISVVGDYLTSRRSLLQTSVSSFLSLCQTDVCDAKRVDGVCDRWARGEDCSEEQIYHVTGDPGTNTKAEMFFNLRSPWNVSCSLGRCTPALGGVYDVFVSEGCIPDLNYISEMQDVSNSVSKQVKIYLRRSAEFYIKVKRKEGMLGQRNCSYGITVGSIEATDSSAKCLNFRKVTATEIAYSNIPYCKDVMPKYNAYVQASTTSQTTFIATLIGVGVLSLALVVLLIVFLRRLRRKRDEKGTTFEDERLKTGEAGGLPLSPSYEEEEDTAFSKNVKEAAGVYPPVLPEDTVNPEATRSDDGKIRQKPEIKDWRRYDEYDLDESEEEVDESAPGGKAGVLDVKPGAEHHFKSGTSGGKLIFQGTSGRSTPASMSSSGSAVDDLYRNRRTAREVYSRGPTPPEQARRGSARPSIKSRGSSRSSLVGADQIDLEDVSRPPTSSSLSSAASSADWEAQQGIRIDDILEQAAAKKTPDGNGSTRKVQQEEAKEAKNWKAGERWSLHQQEPTSSGHASPSEESKLRDSNTSSSDSVKSSESSLKPAPPSEPAFKRHGRPIVAPNLAARLGVIRPKPQGGVRAMASLTPQVAQSQSTEAAPAAPARGEVRAITLGANRALPRAGEAGVPPPPPRRQEPGWGEEKGERKPKPLS
ncbi:hypothetical protein GUITHDRAFT_140245 [Guillardia theta CCMP2712]|uniref:Uncharacterized protein n=1 Tax=Guillardia theta (strain CCMP2712) TaxID=905079 RepID=L1J6W1_GUITC|nr:hypothetical protein GUITHDRAFT_140245 [Guillardia theta CCMP2712]EKX43805.1 hypothetical protein GUITHDRAFT_140245 [Guillardia theta CCMP2712]|eukprot:XP_005830785.1 hypothetical protein GUITHDRAFT_140245 [Guillardia theta CCMP2712]